MIMFWLFVHPLTSIHIRYFLSIPFCSLYIIGVVLFVFVTLETHPYSVKLTREQSHFCKYCNAFVPNNSKHCRQCNKCRVGFDHHCPYVNNCVTTANYNLFYYGILCFFSTGIMNCYGIGHIAYSYKSYQQIYFQKLSKYLSANIAKTKFWALFGVTLVIDLALTIPLGVLIAFHIYFQANNITTYDHILQAQENYPEKMQKFCCKCDRRSRILSMKNED